jgi:hypothetical protein
MKTSFGRRRLSLQRLEDRFVPYSLSGYQWGNVNVSASFMPDGTITDLGNPSVLFATWNAIAPTTIWQPEFARALQTWASVSPLNFHFVADNGAAAGSSGQNQGDSQFGDIRLGESNRSTAGLAAVGYYPNKSGTLPGDIFLNSEISMQIGSYPDLYSVLLHEVGHTIGLAHSDDSSSVMYYLITNVYSGLASDDVAGVQAIYGARKADSYDTGAGNNNFGSATALNVNGMGSVVISADLTSVEDVDYYRVVAPSNFDGTLTVSADASNISLLQSDIAVYDSNQILLGKVSSGTYGSNATLSLNGLVAGKSYYLVADGSTTDVFGMGAYKLNAKFGGGTPPPPKVSNLQFGDGTNQRSSIKSVVITFSSPATIAGPIGDAFTLYRHGSSAPIGNVSFTATQNGNVVTLSNFTGALASYGSLIDGLYDVTIDAAKVSGSGGQLDGNGNGTGGDNYQLVGNTTNKLFRLFGDSNGDGAVDSSDMAAFQLNFGQSQSLFDFDASGQINARDFIEFRKRFGLRI